MNIQKNFFILAFILLFLAEAKISIAGECLSSSSEFFEQLIDKKVDIHSREYAVSCLSSKYINEPTRIKKITSILLDETENENIRIGSLYLLNSLEGKISIPIIRQFLGTKISPNMKIEALTALYNKGEMVTEELKDLFKSLNGSSPDTKVYIAKTIVRNHLLSCKKDKWFLNIFKEIYYECIKTNKDCDMLYEIGLLGGEEEIPIIQPYLMHDNWFIRKNAGMGLANIGSLSVIEQFAVALSKEKHMETKGAFMASLVEILGRNSNTPFKKEWLESLSPYYLDILRNAIYAQHGRAFKSEKLRQYFNKTCWYKANKDYSDKLLSDIEKQNIQLCLKVEQYKKAHSYDFNAFLNGSITKLDTGKIISFNENIRQIRAIPNSYYFVLAVNNERSKYLKILDASTGRIISKIESDSEDFTIVGSSIIFKRRDGLYSFNRDSGLENRIISTENLRNEIILMRKDINSSDVHCGCYAREHDVDGVNIFPILGDKNYLMLCGLVIDLEGKVITRNLCNTWISDSTYVRFSRNVNHEVMYYSPSASLFGAKNSLLAISIWMSPGWKYHYEQAFGRLIDEYPPTYLEIWDTKIWQRRYKLELSLYKIESLKFNPDENYLFISGSKDDRYSDKLLEVLDVNNKSYSIPTKHLGYSESGAFSIDGKYYAAFRYNKGVTVVDLLQMKEKLFSCGDMTGSIFDCNKHITAISFSHDNKFLVFDNGSRIRLWRLERG